jgi:hypothetical protein
MNGATAIASMAKAALGLFHLRPHGVQIVGGRDHGEQQNQCAAQNASEGQGTTCGRRSTPSSPQQDAGHQQRKPAEIKKKLHTKIFGAQETEPNING